MQQLVSLLVQLTLHHASIEIWHGHMNVSL